MQSVRRSWINVITRDCLHPSLVDVLLTFGEVGDTMDQNDVRGLVVSLNESMDANLADDEMFMLTKVLCMEPAPLDGVFLMPFNQSVHMSLDSALRLSLIMILDGMTEAEWLAVLLDDAVELAAEPPLLLQMSAVKNRGVVSWYTPNSSQFRVDVRLLIEHMRAHGLTPNDIVERAQSRDHVFSPAFMAMVNKCG